MDPNEALKNAREACRELDRSGHRDDALDLQEAFEALDEWISRGGFLPEDWQKKK